MTAVRSDARVHPRLAIWRGRRADTGRCPRSRLRRDESRNSNSGPGRQVEAVLDPRVPHDCLGLRTCAACCVPDRPRCGRVGGCAAPVAASAGATASRGRPGPSQFPRGSTTSRPRPVAGQCSRTSARSTQGRRRRDRRARRLRGPAAEPSMHRGLCGSLLRFHQRCTVVAGDYRVHDGLQPDRRPGSRASALELLRSGVTLCPTGRQASASRRELIDAQTDIKSTTELGLDAQRVPPDRLDPPRGISPGVASFVGAATVRARRALAPQAVPTPAELSADAGCIVRRGGNARRRARRRRRAGLCAAGAYRKDRSS